MTTFEKLCKADHILAWMGEDRYSEIKPLQQKTDIGASNIVEWQQLAESIDVLHSKSRTRARGVDKETALVKTPVKHPIPPCPVPSHQPTKRDCKKSIDYKQLHEEGVVEEKRRRVEKYPLPKAVARPNQGWKPKSRSYKERNHRNKVQTLVKWQQPAITYRCAP